MVREFVLSCTILLFPSVNNGEPISLWARLIEEQGLLATNDGLLVDAELAELEKGVDDGVELLG